MAELSSGASSANEMVGMVIKANAAKEIPFISNLLLFNIYVCSAESMLFDQPFG
jgi:hypothetical protein